MDRPDGFHPVLEASTLVVARRAKRDATSAAFPARPEGTARRLRWSPTDLVFITVLVGIIVLNLIDILITLFHTGRHGWGVEGNPLIRIIAENAGAAGAVLFKLIVLALPLIVMWRMYQRAGLVEHRARQSGLARRAVAVHRVQFAGAWVLIGIYLLVVQHNLRIVAT